jgi:hypothetical protein
MMLSPVWMNAKTSVDTDASPNHRASSGAGARSLSATDRIAGIEINLRVPASAVVNLARAVEWFVPKYQQWKADPSKAITEDDVLSVWPTLLDFEQGPVRAIVREPQHVVPNAA